MAIALKDTIRLIFKDNYILMFCVNVISILKHV